MNSLLLLADQDKWIEIVTQPWVLMTAIPLVAILAAFGFKIVKAIVVHRERMAKIEHGIDPDATTIEK